MATKKEAPKAPKADYKPLADSRGEAIEKALALLDPKGTGAPEPGSPGEMIEVFRLLRGAIGLK